MKTKMTTLIFALVIGFIVCAAAASVQARILLEDPGISDCYGASQGFWKNHPELWSDTSLTYNTGTRVMDVFDNAHLVPYMMIPGSEWTLLDVLTITVPYCSQHILFRQAVAALLNAQQFGSDYPLTAQQVIDLVNAALNGGGPFGIRDDKIALAEELDGYNSAGLPKGWP